MHELIIAPSVLSMDYSNTNDALDALKNSKAEWLHFDVMDGHFVPNITFGQDLLRGFKKRTSLFMDVHLMISDPFTYAPIFIENGADMITFHYEAFACDKECFDMIAMIKGKGCKCGIAIKPKTKVEVLLPFLKCIDMILIMSVEPGFGGQKFQATSLDKLRFLHEKRITQQLSFCLQIDGGINQDTAKEAIDVGCDVLVAGSYVFKQNIIERIESLLCLKRS